MRASQRSIRGDDAIVVAGVIGHRQVTDACLAALAQHNDGRLVTLDRELPAQYPETVDLIEV